MSSRYLCIEDIFDVVFHFAIFLAFGIDFTGSVLAYSIFFQWSTVVDRVHIPRSVHTLARDLRAVLLRTRSAIGPAVLLGGAALFLLRNEIGAPMRHLAPAVVTNPDQAATLFLFAIVLPLALGYLGLRAINAAKQVLQHEARAATLAGTNRARSASARG